MPGVSQDLTETDAYARMDWSTMTPVDAPSFFWTASPVCIIANSWNSKDPIYMALADRATFVYFDPTWEEVYKNVGSWFWDQQIFDYAYARIGILKRPTIRIFIKAYEWKVAGLKELKWQSIIDGHCQDETGQKLIRLLDDATLGKKPGSAARIKRWEEETA